jgi:hypothetical protein
VEYLLLPPRIRKPREKKAPAIRPDVADVVFADSHKVPASDPGLMDWAVRVD